MAKQRTKAPLRSDDAEAAMADLPLPQEDAAEAALDRSSRKTSGLHQLYNDVLVSIFKFLSLTELAAVLCVSAAWRAVVRAKLPCARFWLAGAKLLAHGQLAAIARSPLACHVLSLTCDNTLTADDVDSLAQPVWSGLRILYLNEQQPPPRPLTFPPLLHILKLGCAAREGIVWTAEQVAQAVQSASQLPYLESFTFSHYGVFPSLTCLQRTSTLRSLRLMCGLVHLDEVQRRQVLDEIRQMTQLTSLTIRWLLPADLAYLLRPRHRLQLQHLLELRYLDDDAAAVLLSLPSLQRLRASVLRCSGFPFIAQLQQLRELDFDLACLSPTTRAALLASTAAGHFRHLVELALYSGALQSEELSALLAGMPQLRRLCLAGWPELRSLRFLHTPLLIASLVELILENCRALSLAELEHVYALKQLRKLAFWDAFDIPAAELQRLVSPAHCSQLPHLNEFGAC